MLRIAFKSSTILAAVLTGGHAAAGASLVPLDLPLLAKIALALLVGASLVHNLWRHAFLKSHGALVGLELGEQSCRASVHTRGGDWHEARILGSTYVSPLVSVLNLRLDGHIITRHIVIVPDSADAEDFRRLRVRLRWGYRDEP